LNLDSLCPFHHSLKTLHNWALTEGTGKRAMVSPQDARHPQNKAKRPDRDPGPDTSGPPANLPHAETTTHLENRTHHPPNAA
jgi:hypothetical protein